MAKSVQGCHNVLRDMYSKCLKVSQDVYQRLKVFLEVTKSVQIGQEVTRGVKMY